MAADWRPIAAHWHPRETKLVLRRGDSLWIREEDGVNSRLVYLLETYIRTKDKRTRSYFKPHKNNEQRPTVFDVPDGDRL